MPIDIVRVIKGVPEETELAALVAVLHALSHPGSSANPGQTTEQSTPRRAPWTRPRRRSGPAWVAAFDS